MSNGLPGLSVFAKRSAAEIVEELSLQREAIQAGPCMGLTATSAPSAVSALLHIVSPQPKILKLAWVEMAKSENLDSPLNVLLKAEVMSGFYGGGGVELG